MSKTASEIIAQIRQLFADPAAAPAAPVAPVADMQMTSFPVDGGQPVFVNISDDGVPNIDANDAVYSDDAMTIPYPDGAYKVTGTNFGFTVSGGLVSAVDDADGTGAGTPMDAAKVPAAVPPAAAPPADLSKQFAALETKFSAMEISFATHSTEFAVAKETIGKQAQAIEGLLSIVEQLAKTPVSAPPAPAQNFKAEKREERENRLERIAASLKELKSK